MLAYEAPDFPFPTGLTTLPDFRFDRDFGDLFGLPPDNVFLIKLSYGFQL